MPPIHFEKISCTACHSGPRPSDATTLVQTSMSHQLGLPRRATADAAAPTIQEPVFFRDEHTGKLTPNRLFYPSFWARLDERVAPRPLLPEQVAAVAGTGEVLGPKSAAKAFTANSTLTEQQIIQVLDKLAAAVPPATMPSGDRHITENVVTAIPVNEPVFVTGGLVYLRPAGGSGKLASIGAPGCEPYTWPIAHDVRGAQQALGARGCTECHTNGSPFFDSSVNTASLLANASTTVPMHVAASDRIASMRVFNATYRLRWPLIFLGYFSATVLLLVYLKQKLPAIGRRHRS
jgi:hypothetical protein